MMANTANRVGIKPITRGKPDLLKSAKEYKELANFINHHVQDTRGGIYELFPRFLNKSRELKRWLRLQWRSVDVIPQRTKGYRRARLAHKVLHKAWQAKIRLDHKEAGRLLLKSGVLFAVAANQIMDDIEKSPAFKSRVSQKSAYSRMSNRAKVVYVIETAVNDLKSAKAFLTGAIADVNRSEMLDARLKVAKAVRLLFDAEIKAGSVYYLIPRGEHPEVVSARLFKNAAKYIQTIAVYTRVIRDKRRPYPSPAGQKYIASIRPAIKRIDTVIRLLLSLKSRVVETGYIERR